ncbi:MAG: type II toxin-antitoxin system Phd/YefM family antitoxin, partial [Pseudanabaena sp. M007S1SP1A06QC]|nr:type II toxin-antitoxin system Phd/YefM family antitoxin [Pseudanabaena sp. M007S1SP1A06QC]
MLNLNPELITKDGKPMFAVIPYEQFLAIKEMLEDFQDLQDLR